MTVIAADSMDRDERIAMLLRSFKLPTVSAELVVRLVDAGFTDALEVVLGQAFSSIADALSGDP